MKAFLARRSAVIALSAAALLGGLGALPAQAQSFPAKPIKLVVPYAPGGGVDIVARTLADYISTKLGKLVIGVCREVRPRWLHAFAWIKCQCNQ